MIDLRSALRLYLVADPDHCPGDLLTTVRSAIQGGVSMVQLRAKNMTDLEASEIAKSMAQLCKKQGVPFLVNDRVDLALASGADGVHLGVDDLAIEDAIALGGNDFIVGYSPESDDQLTSAAKRGASYLGIGPVFGTATKNDAGEALGLDVFSKRIQMGSLPAVGIGGITAENASDVMAAGANGVAVVSAILSAADPGEAASQISRNS